MKVTDNIFMLEASKYSHVFLVKSDENILIDTGMPGLAGKIAGELQTLGVDIGSVKKILLTHHDVDHIGSAKALREASGAELWAPAPDVPYITGEKKRGGRVKRFASALMRAPKPEITGTYDNRREFCGIQAISAPGHTPGHTIFLYDGVLFAGDLLRHLKGRFGMLPSVTNWYLKDARESVGLLKTLDFEWFCPAHGQPVRKGEALVSFLEQF
ncbi:MAG: MBL fold metallo-hydrolase [Clostridiales bacterium]|nr:MBL fold metallo-hydrolase [Clostridiales bacterium]